MGRRRHARCDPARELTGPGRRRARVRFRSRRDHRSGRARFRSCRDHRSGPARFRSCRDHRSGHRSGQARFRSCRAKPSKRKAASRSGTAEARSRPRRLSTRKEAASRASRHHRRRSATVGRGRPANRRPPGRPRWATASDACWSRGGSDPAAASPPVSPITTAPVPSAAARRVLRRRRGGVLGRIDLDTRTISETWTQRVRWSGSTTSSSRSAPSSLESASRSSSVVSVDAVGSKVWGSAAITSAIVGGLSQETASTEIVRCRRASARR